MAQQILPVNPSREEFQRRWQAMPPWQRAVLMRRIVEQRRQQNQQGQQGMDPGTAANLGYQGYQAATGAGAGIASSAGYGNVAASGLHAGTSASTGAGAAAAWPIAAVLAIPAIGQMLDDKNEKYQVRALRDLMTGNATGGPMGLGITQRGNATFVGGDSNALDRALEHALSRGITARMIRPNLASFDAGPEQTKKHLQFTSGQKDRFSDEKNRAVARATENARDQGYRVTQKNVTNNRGMVRHAFQPQNIERRRLQGGR